VFPKSFSSYDDLTVRAIVEQTPEAANVVNRSLERIPTRTISKELHPEMQSDVAYSISVDESSPELKDAMEENKIQIAPAAHLVNLNKKADEKGLILKSKDTMNEFDFYNVELGLNILLGKGYEIPRLRFMIEIFGDNNKTADVIAYDAFPHNQVKKVQIIGGKISLGVSAALSLIPFPLGQTISNLLQVDLNPWEFSWTYDKIDLLFSGRLSYELNWDLRHKNIYQGFNPTLILRKRKRVNSVIAKIKVIYNLKSPRSWNFRRKVDFETEQKDILIFPNY
jgi:hypothetical protein